MCFKPREGRLASHIILVSYREHVEQFFIDNGIDASFPSSSEDEASVDGDRPMATKRLSDGIAAVEMQALTVSPTDKKNSEFETTHMVQSQSSDSHSSPFIIDGDRSNSSTPVTVDTPPYVNDVIQVLEPRDSPFNSRIMSKN